MATLHDISKFIINELIRLQNRPVLDHSRDGRFQFPIMIGVSDGRLLLVSTEMNDAIHEFADQLLSADSSLAPKVMRTEWREKVRMAFGQSLAMLDLEHPIDDNASKAVREVRSSLTTHVEQYGTCETALGCTLFENSAIKAFHIGPASFEPRADWLARKTVEGAISETAGRTIASIWSGQTLEEREFSIDTFFVHNVIDAVGTCPYVCSVATDGLSREASRERALVTARLALASIALTWSAPSRVLEGLNLLYDRQAHQKSALTFIPGKILTETPKMSHRPHGPRLKDGEWEMLFAQNSAFFGVVGEILHYVVDSARGASRKEILNALQQALFWFHEGCRESVPLMGVVKFMATLEALAGGGGSGGIKRLITARLGLQENEPIKPGGPAMKTAVKWIYNEVRSGTVHGKNEKLSHDWSGAKGVSEELANLCLYSCIAWVAANPSSTNLEQMSS